MADIGYIYIYICGDPLTLIKILPLSLTGATLGGTLLQTSLFPATTSGFFEIFKSVSIFLSILVFIAMRILWLFRSQSSFLSVLPVSLEVGRLLKPPSLGFIQTLLFSSRLS